MELGAFALSRPMRFKSTLMFQNTMRTLLTGRTSIQQLANHSHTARTCSKINDVDLDSLCIILRLQHLWCLSAFLYMRTLYVSYSLPREVRTTLPEVRATKQNTTAQNQCPNKQTVSYTQ